MKKSLATLLTVMLVSGISCSIYADELPEFTGIVIEGSVRYRRRDQLFFGQEERCFRLRERCGHS